MYACICRGVQGGRGGDGEQQRPAWRDQALLPCLNVYGYRVSPSDDVGFHEPGAPRGATESSRLRCAWRSRRTVGSTAGRIRVASKRPPSLARTRTTHQVTRSFVSSASRPVSAPGRRSRGTDATGSRSRWGREGPWSIIAILGSRIISQRQSYAHPSPGPPSARARCPTRPGRSTAPPHLSTPPSSPSTGP